MKNFILGLCCFLTLSAASFASELTVRPGIYRSADYPGCNFNVEIRKNSLILIANVAPGYSDSSCLFGYHGSHFKALTKTALSFQCSSLDFNNCTTPKVVTAYCDSWWCDVTPEAWYQLSFHLMDDGRLTVTQTFQRLAARTSEVENTLLYFAAQKLEPFVFQRKVGSNDPDLSLNTNCNLAKAGAVESALDECRQHYYSCTMQSVEFKRSPEGVSCSATAFILGAN